MGGVESLIELPRLMTHDTAEGTEAAIEDDLIRISVGLEDYEDLIDDLETALNAAKVKSNPSTYLLGVCNRFTFIFFGNGWGFG